MAVALTYASLDRGDVICNVHDGVVYRVVEIRRASSAVLNRLSKHFEPFMAIELEPLDGGERKLELTPESERIELIYLPVHVQATSSIL